MKNTLKILGVAVTALILTLSFASCKESSNGGGDEGDKPQTTINGETITSGVEINYPEDWVKNKADAETYTDFSFFRNGVWNGEKYIYTIYPISDYINSPASITLSDGKVTIKLGTPKEPSPLTFSDYKSIDLTYDKSAKLFWINWTCTENAKYGLDFVKDENGNTSLVYADKDVTIKGTVEWWEWVASEGKYSEDKFTTDKWDVSFKKGWNYFWWTPNAAGDTWTSKASLTLPDGYHWVVYDVN